MAGLLFVYYVFTLRAEQKERDRERRWLDRLSESWTNPPGHALLMAGAILLLVGFGYGLGIGFWVAAGILAVLVGAWIVRRIRGPSSHDR